MEYCFNTSFDILEVIKLLSPWLLAYVVYKIWHKQKGKEIISSEAKNYITLLIQLEKQEQIIINEMTNNISQRDIIKSYAKYREIYSELVKSITFLTYSLKGDKKYIKLSNKFLNELLSSRSGLKKYIYNRELEYTVINKEITEEIKEYLYNYVVFKKF